MPGPFRILDLREDPPTEHVVEHATNPQKAGQLALGFPLVRSGARRNFVAKVYFEGDHGMTTMVRLYKAEASSASLATSM